MALAALKGIAGLPKTAMFQGDKSDGPLTTGNIQHGNTRIVEEITCDDADLDSTIRAIIGEAGWAGGAERGAIGRTLPLAHPRWDFLYADAITNLHGVGWAKKDRAGAARAKRWSLTVAFANPPYTVQPVAGRGLRELGRFLTRDTESYEEFVTYPAPMQYATSNDVTRIGQPVLSGQSGKQLVKLLLTWTWWLVPERAVLDVNGIPFNFMTCSGNLNEKTWPGGSGNPAGTLLCGSPKLQRVAPGFRLGSDPYYHVTLPLKYWYNGGHGWNYSSIDNDGTFQKGVTTAGSSPIYPSVDFNKFLFVPL